MSTADNMIFNTLEKPTSVDLNDMQSIAGRNAMTLERFRHVTRQPGLGAGNDTETVNPVVAGMQVVPNGPNVSIQPGRLLQDSAALSPVPGTYDSSYRYAAIYANQAVTAPSPVTDTYYLLEVQAASVPANASRSILSTVLKAFVPTSVPKHDVRTVVAQWVTGTATAFPAPTGGDWVVLAGVFRPAGGGSVLNTHIVDMRLHADLLIHEAGLDSPSEAQVSRAQMVPGISGLSITADAPVRCGGRALRCNVRSYTSISGTWDPDSATIRSPATTYAADTWYYVYLTHWRNLAPRVTRSTTGPVSRGVPVISHITPDEFGNANSATITLPDPYSGLAVPIGEARCVSILRRNASNTGFVNFTSANNFTHMIANPFASTSGLVQLGTSAVVSGSNRVELTVTAATLPRARLIKWYVQGSLTYAAPVGATEGHVIQVSPGGSTIGNRVHDWVRSPVGEGSTSSTMGVTLWAPYDTADLMFLSWRASVATVATGSLTAYVTGWML